MLLGSLSSEQEALERLTADVDAAFGARTDEYRGTVLSITAHALWLLSRESLGAYEAEPDFVAGAGHEGVA